MKKNTLFMLTCFCSFIAFSHSLILWENFEKGFFLKNCLTSCEAIKYLNISEDENFDSDSDGIFDSIDIDDDNDGIKDVDEEIFCRNSPISIIVIYCDTDDDGVPDKFDLDSDNDGIPDVVEAGFGYLSEGRATLTNSITWVDTNGNGLHDLTETTVIPDTDGDGVPNYLDLDSDNDSLYDVDESGAGNSSTDVLFGYENGDGDINGDGVGDGMDSEIFRNKDDNEDGILEYFGDGILDIFDYFEGIDFASSYGNSNQGASPLFVKDTDGDGIPDYLDLISNGSLFDISGTLFANLDANGDGIIDGQTDFDYDGILDNFDTNTAFFGSPRNLNQKLHLYFDGRNDFIEEDNGTNTVNGLAEATMMAWVKLDLNFISHGAIMGQTNFWIRINGSTRRLRVEIPDTKPFTTPPGVTPLSLNKWTHVAVVFEGLNSLEKVKLFINGEKVASINPEGLGLTIPTSANTKFRIGRAPSNLDINNALTADMFKGEIDEVRVFNKALTDEEIQKMVYQELDTVNGFNGGAVIPLDISPTIGANLLRYYRMDVFKDDIVDNLTTPTIDIGTGAKMYNFKNIYPQTAPLPYETKTDGDWSNVASWLHGDVWDISSEITNKDWTIVHVKNNLTTTKNHNTLGIIIDKDKKLSIKAGQELKNFWYLELDGAILLEDESQLIQTEGSILDQDSGGFIERDQQGTANSFNYNYWSSSVGPITPLGLNQKGTGAASVNESFSIKNVLMDGTFSGEPNKNGEIHFISSFGAADSSIASPIIISSHWLYTFNGANNDFGKWKSINENTPILTGEGYTMKGTSGDASITSEQNYVFKGKPNNGDIAIELKKIMPTANNPLGDVERLIGNPYPSAIDADLFIKDHIINHGTNGGQSDTNIFNGTLYFWDHFGEKNSHYLKDYVGGYATYTLMGGTKAIANDHRINNTSSLVSSKTPGRFIPVAQGFFVGTALSESINGISEVSGGTITFKNSHRYFKTEGNNSANSESVFLKSSNSKSAKKEQMEEDTRSKIRLLFHSPKSYSRQLLIGTDKNTTNNFDLGYDGFIADTAIEDLFWLIQDAKFVIQGVPLFNEEQEFQLGLKIAKAGLAKIKIEELKNMDENISVYIKDKLTDKMHNISLKPFEINLEAGNYFNRFSLTFKIQKLVAEDVETGTFLVDEPETIQEDFHIFMNNAIGELQIKSNTGDAINSIKLYNYLGQTVEIWESNLHKKSVSLPLKLATGVYIAELSAKNKKFIKKIVVL